MSYRDCLPGEPPLDPPHDGGYEQAFAEWVAELDPALSCYLGESVLRRLFAERCERERAYAL